MRKGYRNYRGYNKGFSRNRKINSNSNSNINSDMRRWNWEKITVELSKFLNNVKAYDREVGAFVQQSGDIFDVLTDINRKFLFEKSVVKVIGFERVDNVIHVKLLVLKSFNTPAQSKTTQPQPNSTQTQLS